MRALTLCLLIPLAGCSTIGIERRGPVYGPGPAGNPYPREEVYERGHPGSLAIPPGHLPPPGSCRIWFPGRPPGQQPPPGDCAQLARSIPAGAWLVSRPSHEPEHVHVSVYDPSRAGVVVEVRIFESATGRFLRHQDSDRGRDRDEKRDGDRRDKDHRDRDRR